MSMSNDKSENTILSHIFISYDDSLSDEDNFKNFTNDTIDSRIPNCLSLY